MDQRAIALYLTQNSGRRYETLFSDEADGPLDPERKRMFMAMKREVLRVGGYTQEFFVSRHRNSRPWPTSSSIWNSIEMRIKRFGLVDFTQVGAQDHRLCHQ